MGLEGSLSQSWPSAGSRARRAAWPQHSGGFQGAAAELGERGLSSDMNSRGEHRPYGLRSRKTAPTEARHQSQVVTTFPTNWL